MILDYAPSGDLSPDEDHLLNCIQLMITSQLSKSVDRWSIRSTGARVQKLRGGSAGGSWNWHDADDQHREGHPP